MAKTYPDKLPQSVISDPKRGAEKKVYGALSQLSNAFVVFYSVAWQARRGGITRDGEADFVIAHPDLGVLVLEVKGGGVDYDASTGQWSTTDRHGNIFTIDPVEQARKSHHTLLDKLCDLPNWDSSRFLTIGHAVCFPDVVIKSKFLKLDLPREIVIDNDDLDSIEAGIGRIFKHYSRQSDQGSLGIDRLAIVEGLLAKSFNITTPLGVEIAKEDEKLVELTEQQTRILDYLSTRRRAAIAGCAGSGKTMLAVEKARRLSEQGFYVLLTCFNAALAQDLAQRLPDITILNFHDLCKEFAKEAGFNLRPAKDEQEYYEVILPDMLLEASEDLGPRFDAIVVDEGQDFKEHYWIALASLLNEKTGIFYVFYDDNQNLYGGAASLAGIVDEPPFPLTENCRNTQAIHKVVASFYSSGSTVTCRGPVGRVPTVQIYHDSADMLRSLQSTVYHLVHEEHVSAEDIVILTPHGQEKSLLRPNARLGNFVLTSNVPHHGNQIQATSVHRFKGLERRVVIVAELDSAFKFHPEVVMYVGCSRARTHLIFFMAVDAPIELKQVVEAACKPTA